MLTPAKHFGAKRGKNEDDEGESKGEMQRHKQCIMTTAVIISITGLSYSDYIF
jgi:hypothetical protein